MGSSKGRGNQYIEFARVLYCKLPTNGKHLPAFPLEVVTGIEPRPQRWGHCGRDRPLPLSMLLHPRCTATMEEEHAVSTVTEGP